MSTLHSGGDKVPANEKNSINKSINNLIMRGPLTHRRATQLLARDQAVVNGPEEAVVGAQSGVRPVRRPRDGVEPLRERVVALGLSHLVHSYALLAGLHSLSGK